MKTFIDQSSDDLFSNISFGGGGGGGGGGAPRNSHTISRVPAAVVKENVTSGNNPADPQGAWGRPTFDEGDAYSGDQSYGAANGR